MSRPGVDDGFDGQDGGEVVIISRDGPSRYRWTCPFGHTNWEPTGDHIWCRECAKNQPVRGPAADGRHWQLVDKKDRRTIPWRCVEVER